MENILEVQNLRKEYKDFTLKDISFNLKKGYIMGFIGPNGAGKTTTIKLMLNLIQKDSGQIKIFGKNHKKNEREIKDRIGFVFDKNYYYEELTLKDMKRIIAPLYSQWDNQMFNQYIERFNLPINQKIKEFSKGMQMKASLAVALSHHADLLVMDEPTSGLDPVIRSELLDILGDFIQDEQKAVFFSTHITSDLDKIADYVTFIDNGEIVLSSTKDEILDNYGLVKGRKELLNSQTKEIFVGVDENSFGFEGLVTDRGEAKKVLGDEIIIEKPSLEDIMLYQIKRS